MPIISNGQSLHEMSNPVFWEKIDVSSDESAHSGKG